MSSNRQAKDHIWGLYILVITLALALGYFLFSPQKLFKPGDEIGYNLGLVGGVMMTILLLYPIRKRIPLLSKLGKLPSWFKWHMILGILGPTFIIFHSTFHIHSVNAAVAMVCMLLVSGSGTFGRFFYTKIHHGLYGRQATVNELRGEMERSGDVKSVFSFAPSVEKALDEFRARAESYAKQSGVGFIHFITVGYQAARLSTSLSKELREIMHVQAKQGKLSDAELAGMEDMIAVHQESISLYLKAVRDASQFHTYERLFSWWHIFHIPLVYMMVFSAIYHVYAVHAY